jgi:predicted N-formylglutamate amidohydrolase
MANRTSSKAQKKWTLLISCEHAGNKVPAPYLKQMNRSQQMDLPTHKGWDPGALIMARHLAKALDAPLFFTQISRLLVDSNRSSHHAQCLGPAFRCLSKEERQFILAQYYWPHRQLLENEVKKCIQNGSSVLHLALHSFTPVLHDKKRLAEVGLLYDPQRGSEKEWADFFVQEFRQELVEMRIRRNYPYLGKADGLTTWLRKRFAVNEYAGIEIELNQALMVRPKDRTLIKQGLTRSVRRALIRPF